jgi:PAS domain S-box-containing protein
MMSAPESPLSQPETPPGTRQLGLAHTPDFAPERSADENGQRALLNILEDFAAEKTRLERGQRAILNILDDFDAEKARMEGAQRAVLNILEDSVAEKEQSEGARRSMLNILDDFSEEKGRLEETQSAVLNILDDFEMEKSRVNLANEQLEKEIEEREKIEDALRAGEERFRNLAETASDAIVSADSHGCIVYFNRAAEQIFGYPAGEAIGQPLTLLMPERFQNPHREGLHRYLKTGEARVVGKSVELAGRKKDGTEFPLQLSLSSWKTGRDTFFTGILSDITERKEAQETSEQHRKELARTNAGLVAANKELEAFSYSVSHDLRSPLRSIDGFSLALLEDYADKLDEDGRDCLHRVRAATQRMGTLIDDMLNLSRMTRIDMRLESADLGAIARSVAVELQKTQPERRVEFRIEEGLEAFVDSHLIKIAFDNLLGNAWKFTSKRVSACIEFGGTHRDGKLTYYVRDDGAGFDPTYADRLFGAFQRLHDKNEFPGTGVGLATVQRIIHRHGGRIWAESAVGRGATFYFTLLESMPRGA